MPAVSLIETLAANGAQVENQTPTYALQEASFETTLNSKDHIFYNYLTLTIEQGLHETGITSKKNQSQRSHIARCLQVICSSAIQEDELIFVALFCNNCGTYAI